MALPPGGSNAPFSVTNASNGLMARAVQPETEGIVLSGGLSFPDCLCGRQMGASRPKQNIGSPADRAVASKYMFTLQTYTSSVCIHGSAGPASKAMVALMHRSARQCFKVQISWWVQERSGGIHIEKGVGGE